MSDKTFCDYNVSSYSDGLETLVNIFSHIFSLQKPKAIKAYLWHTYCQILVCNDRKPQQIEKHVRGGCSPSDLIHVFQIIFFCGNII